MCLRTYDEYRCLRHARLTEFFRPHESRGVKIFRLSCLLEDLELKCSTCGLCTGEDVYPCRPVSRELFVPLAIGVSEFYLAKGSSLITRDDTNHGASRPDRFEGWLVSSTRSRQRIFAPDTFVSIDVSVMTTIVGQKGDKTTRSEPFMDKMKVFQ